MRNWTIKEAVAVVNEGKDQAAIKEIAKHFPMTFMCIVKNDLAGLAEAMNEKFTLRRVEQGFGTDNNADVEEDVDNNNANDVAEDTAEAEDTGAEDLGSMSTKQLMALCDKRGIKVPHYGKNKQFYLDALQSAGATDEADADEDVAEDVEEAEEATDAYEGKSAMELYKECKKRGIKVEAKKNAKYYIAALKKADEEAVEEEAEDEDWEDDEVEEEAPKAPAKSAKDTKGGKGKKVAEKAPAKSGSKKSAPKAEAEDDEDDDWDI